MNLKKTFAAGLVALGALLPVAGLAEFAAKSVIYAEPETGLTFVVGEIAEIDGQWNIEQPAAGAAVSQVYWVTPGTVANLLVVPLPPLSKADAEAKARISQKVSKHKAGRLASTLVKGAAKAAAKAAADPAKGPYMKISRRMMALLRDKNADEVLLTLSRIENGETKTETVRWKIAGAPNAVVADAASENAAAPADSKAVCPDCGFAECENFSKGKWVPVVKKLRKDWLHARYATWAALSPENSPSPLVRYWKSQPPFAAAAADADSLRSRRRSRDRDDEHSAALGALSILGGKTAIHETLQTQLIAAAAAPKPGETAVDIATIKGVEVKAHPYAAMLAQIEALKGPLKETPARTLADFAPPDRLFVLLREPRQLASLLAAGADDVMVRLTPLLGESFADHALLARYTAKFGLTPEQARQWFSGGNVAEVALITPDIFFRDNTDLTFVIRLKPNATTPFRFAKKLPGTLTVPLPSGGSFHLASRDDLLFLSTNKAELENCLALATAGGKGSLGQLDEFRVMTHKLPIVSGHKDIGAGGYVYFSDPFIRRLTGPAVKIGQLRRSAARIQMERATMAALAYRLDYGTDAPDIATLVKRGYLAASLADVAPDVTLAANAVATSAQWGSLAKLRALTERPVTTVTPAEAAAYADYRDTYTKMWREYFDPIGVRLDIAKDGTIGLETFILPLIDNSLYNGIRETYSTVQRQKVGDSRLPQYREPPIATLAFTLPESFAARRMRREFEKNFETKFLPLLPLLGDTIVVSVRDSAPVLQTTFPALNDIGKRSAISGTRAEELLWAPLVGALFTRPVDIAIPVNDAAAARAAVRAIYSGTDRWGYIGQQNLYIEAENRLIATFSIEHVIQLELSISVENGWLHISNHPWTHVPIVGDTALPANHAVVEFAPANLKLGLSQALAAADTAYRNSVYSTAAELLPWMVAYGVDAPAAQKLQRAALGHATAVPAGIELRTPQLRHTTPFGTWLYPRTPTLNLADTGLAKGLRQLRLWMRFEDDGLRSRVEFSPE